MHVYIQLKSLSKRRPVLNKIPYALPDGISTLRQLIEALVRWEVETYNERGVEQMLMPFLTETEIVDQSAVGKIGFGRLYSERKADARQAVATAIQGFEDGLFRVMVGEAEAKELDAPIAVRENDVLTFIRLTFLAGRLW